MNTWTAMMVGAMVGWLTAALLTVFVRYFIIRNIDKKWAERVKRLKEEKDGKPTDL